METPTIPAQIINFRINKSVPEYLVQYPNQQPLWVPYSKLQSMDQISVYNRKNHIPESLLADKHSACQTQPIKRKANDSNSDGREQATRVPYPILREDKFELQIVCLEYSH